jgi:hypothetical protein
LKTENRKGTEFLQFGIFQFGSRYFVPSASQNRLLNSSLVVARRLNIAVVGEASTARALESYK